MVAMQSGFGPPPFGFGRLYTPDNRDLAYPTSTIQIPVVAPAMQYWRAGPILDQDGTPKCVGYAWRQYMDMSPHRDPLNEPPDADTIYAQAQLIDGWPMPHDGTSVRAAAKVLQSMGIIKSYHWAFNEADVRAFLLTTGPMVLGTNWYSGMMQGDGNGFVNVTGSIVAGHAWVAEGYSVRLDAYRCLNSWSEGWNQFGRFWIKSADLARLVSEHGEACAALK